jgi:hypothetical protein
VAAIRAFTGRMLLAAIANEEHRALADRIGACEEATADLLVDQEKRIAVLETKLAELERRLAPAKPRLVGGSDAAA